MRNFLPIISRAPSTLCALSILMMLVLAAPVRSQDIDEIVAEFSSYGDRSSGSEGSARTADFIADYFTKLCLDPQTYYFQIPTRQVHHASITLDDQTVNLSPLMNNAVTPQAIDGQIEGPLYWVDKGNLSNLDQKLIKDAILLMDFNSGSSWLTAASLGASAVIFIDFGATATNSFFREKQELSPIRFPSYWMEEQQAKALFGNYREADNGLVRDRVTLSSQITWKNSTERTIYSLIEGSDPELSEELIIIEAFYDSTAHVAGRSPGADESISIASLLKLAEHFSTAPPGHSLLFVATSGHAQSLHGMRELIWSMQERTKGMRDRRSKLKKMIAVAEEDLELIDSISFPLANDPERDALLAKAIENDLRYAIDQSSTRLMNLRMRKESGSEEQIKILADQRYALRRLSWTQTYHDLPEEEQKLLADLLPTVIQTKKDDIVDFEDQLQALESALDFRQLTRDYDMGAVLSLHLSSHGEGIGGFHRGWLYKLRPLINRTGMFSTIGEIFEESGANAQGTARYVNS